MNSKHKLLTEIYETALHFIQTSLPIQLIKRSKSRISVCTVHYVDNKFYFHLECTNGYYGQNCSNSCSSNCRKQYGKTTCDPVNGECLQNCKDGWQGPLCDKGKTMFLVIRNDKTLYLSIVYLN